MQSLFVTTLTALATLLAAQQSTAAPLVVGAHLPSLTIPGALQQARDMAQAEKQKPTGNARVDMNRSDPRARDARDKSQP